MYFFKKLVALSILATACASAFSQTSGNKTYSRNEIDAVSKKAAAKQLLFDADLAFRMKPVSVTDNPPIPLSKNRNDFYSWLPYSWPNPETKDGHPYVNKDGQTNPVTEKISDKPLLRKMAVATYTLALAFQLTKEKKYAQKSAMLIRTWFLDPKTKMNPNLNFGQCKPGVEIGTSTGIIDARWFLLVIDAHQILKKANVLSVSEQKGLQQWFSNFLDWMLTSKIGIEEGKKPNNHGTWYAAQSAYYGYYTGNNALAKKIVTNSKQFFDKQIDTSGRQILELKRTKSFDYSLYNVHALITLAKIGDSVGIDLWKYNMANGGGKNILQSVKYLAEFSAPNANWPYQQIAEKAISLGMEDGDHFSVYYPYDLYGALSITAEKYKDPELLQLFRELKASKGVANRANLNESVK